MEEVTLNFDPRILLMVFTLAGDSTITSALDIVFSFINKENRAAFQISD